MPYFMQYVNLKRLFCIISVLAVIYTGHDVVFYCVLYIGLYNDFRCTLKLHQSTRESKIKYI
jgi:hypothetical protein